MSLDVLGSCASHAIYRVSRGHLCWSPLSKESLIAILASIEDSILSCLLQETANPIAKLLSNSITSSVTFIKEKLFQGMPGGGACSASSPEDLTIEEVGPDKTSTSANDLVDFVKTRKREEERKKLGRCRFGADKGKGQSGAVEEHSFPLVSFIYILPYFVPFCCVISHVACLAHQYIE